MPTYYNPPTYGEEFSFDISLEDYANPGNFKTNPTLAIGDIQVMKDAGAYANITTLPTVTPAGTDNVPVTLSATEMSASRVKIRFQDQTSPKEWSDVVITILTTAP
jgi:hypothetical protein